MRLPYTLEAQMDELCAVLRFVWLLQRYYGVDNFTIFVLSKRLRKLAMPRQSPGVANLQLESKQLNMQLTNFLHNHST